MQSGKNEVALFRVGVMTETSISHQGSSLTLKCSHALVSAALVSV